MSETERLQDVAAKLESRRKRIARAQRGLGVLADAYGLVAQDLRAAATARDDQSEETTR